MNHHTERNEALSLQEICHSIHVDEDWIVELVEYGVIEPEGRRREEWRFRMQSVARLRQAARLYGDLGVNVPGLAVVLDLLEEMERLRLQLRQRDLPPSRE